MTPSPASSPWPALPLADWQETYDTLHMWTQIAGKTRLALAAPQNHWWHTTLYVTPRGLTTSAMPAGDRTIAVEFDFIAHELQIITSNGARAAIPLAAQPVADFYTAYCAAFQTLGVDKPGAFLLGQLRPRHDPLLRPHGAAPPRRGAQLSRLCDGGSLFGRV